MAAISKTVSGIEALSAAIGSPLSVGNVVPQAESFFSKLKESLPPHDSIVGKVGPAKDSLLPQSPNMQEVTLETSTKLSGLAGAGPQQKPEIAVEKKDRPLQPDLQEQSPECRLSERSVDISAVASDKPLHNSELQHQHVGAPVSSKSNVTSHKKKFVAAEEKISQNLGSVSDVPSVASSVHLPATVSVLSFVPQIAKGSAKRSEGVSEKSTTATMPKSSVRVENKTQPLSSTKQDEPAKSATSVDSVKAIKAWPVLKDAIEEHPSVSASPVVVPPVLTQGAGQVSLTLQIASHAVEATQTPFEAMDSAPLELQPAKSHTSVQQMEIAVSGTSHGVVHLRAEIDMEGGVHLTATAPTERTHDTLTAEVPRIREFLATEQVRVDTLQVSTHPQAHRSSDGNASNSSLAGNPQGGEQEARQQHEGSSKRQAPAQILNFNLSAASHGTPPTILHNGWINLHA